MAELKMKEPPKYVYETEIEWSGEKDLKLGRGKLPAIAAGAPPANSRACRAFWRKPKRTDSSRFDQECDHGGAGSGSSSGAILVSFG